MLKHRSYFASICLCIAAGAFGGISGGIAKWAGQIAIPVAKVGLYLCVGVCNAGMSLRNLLVVERFETMKALTELTRKKQHGEMQL